MSWYVIAFSPGREELAKDLEFQRRVGDADNESLALLSVAPHKISVAPLIEIRIYPNALSNGPIDELNQYRSVYFLNEAAMVMCNEIGLQLPLIDKMQNIPDNFGYLLRGHYLPRAQR